MFPALEMDPTHRHRRVVETDRRRHGRVPRVAKARVDRNHRAAIACVDRDADGGRQEFVFHVTGRGFTGWSDRRRRAVERVTHGFEAAM